MSNFEEILETLEINNIFNRESFEGRSQEDLKESYESFLSLVSTINVVFQEVFDKIEDLEMDSNPEYIRGLKDAADIIWAHQNEYEEVLDTISEFYNPGAHEE